METKRYLIWESGKEGHCAVHVSVTEGPSAYSAAKWYSQHMENGSKQDLCVVCTTDVSDSWQGTAKAPVVELTERGA